MGEYLSNTFEKELTDNNFDFVKRTLGLGEPFEVTWEHVGKKVLILWFQPVVSLLSVFQGFH